MCVLILRSLSAIFVVVVVVVVATAADHDHFNRHAKVMGNETMINSFKEVIGKYKNDSGKNDNAAQHLASLKMLFVAMVTHAN